MKKIAFYVEGQTEQYFIKNLLTEIAGQKNINIDLERFAGKCNSSIQILNLSSSPTSKYYALIYDCMGDGSVKPRILEDYASLFAAGHSKVIGLRDLFPLTDLAKLERTMTKVSPLPTNAEIIIAVNEVEAWFLAEINHYSCIDSNITATSIISNLGFNPVTDDMTLRPNPAKDLNDIYKLVGKAYSKSRSHVVRTVECIDYCNMYLNLPPKITELKRLIDIIDNFLT